MSRGPRKPQRSDSWDLDLKPLKESEARASERVAARILGKHVHPPTDVDVKTENKVPETKLVSGTNISEPNLVESTNLVPQTNEVTDQRASWSETNEVQQTNLVLETLFPPVDGFLTLPNTIVDTLWGALDEFETKVYVRLYRLSHGFGEELCRVGLDRLASSCKLSRSTIQRTIERLERHGLVEQVSGAAARGVGRARGITKGNVYRVNVPGGKLVHRTKMVSETNKVRETKGVRQTLSKEHEKTHEKAPVAVAPADISSILRTEAETYRAKYPNATDDVVHARLDAFVKDRGWRVDEGAIDEAISSRE